jgi:hypothetical protein
MKVQDYTKKWGSIERGIAALAQEISNNNK